jgi:DNA helicase-2/ATP-dependent DNA helicase PcrA
VLAASREKVRTVWETLQNAQSIPELSAGVVESVQQFISLVERYRNRFDGGALSHVARELLVEVGFAEATRAHAKSAAVAQRKLDSVEELLKSLHSYEQRETRKASLMSYLNRLGLDNKEEEAGGRSVSLMTLHSAKGLEFRLVFLVGMEEDLLPHKGMQGEPPNLEEERRLCYVGFTRAKERLILTRAATRLRRGKEVPRTPSRFLEGLPEAWITLKDLSAPPPGPPTEREMSFFADLKARLKDGKVSVA